LQLNGTLRAGRELAALRAGSKDLDDDYDSTIELAEHLWARRAADRHPVDVESVLLELEACLRSMCTTICCESPKRLARVYSMMSLASPYSRRCCWSSSKSVADSP
jgi:hypothetical protein